MSDRCYLLNSNKYSLLLKDTEDSAMTVIFLGHLVWVEINIICKQVLSPFVVFRSSMQCIQILY